MEFFDVSFFEPVVGSDLNFEYRLSTPVDGCDDGCDGCEFLLVRDCEPSVVFAVIFVSKAFAVLVVTV